MIDWLRKKVCKHEFYTDAITITGIKELQYPKAGATYEEYAAYHGSIYSHPSITHYTYCQCHKCFGHFYSNGGLNLPGKLKRREQ